MNDTLKLTSPMMHGPAVKRLQEMTDILGYDLGPNDGIFGKKTRAEVFDFQNDEGLKYDGIFGPVTRKALLEAVSDTTINLDKPKSGIIDISDKHKKPKLYSAKRSPRPRSQIVGVTLHQTGCEMPKDPMGWCRTNAHIGITQEGLAILLNPLVDFIWHAQGLSKNTIGIEIEGNYCGLDGDMKTLWKGGGGPHHLNDKMMEATERVFDYLANWFGRKNFEIYAHRQSYNTRIADPGEEIWKKIAIPWGATLEEGRIVKGTGRVIPKLWDEDAVCSARYY